jgi:hypothetical protein
MFAFVAAALLFQVHVEDLRQPATPCPFVLVTAAGERVGSLDRPNHDGKPVKFRVCPHGTLTMFPERDVDWPATEKANTSGPTTTPTPSLSLTPTRASLQGYAKQTSLRDGEAAVKQNQTLSGKMKIGDRIISLDDSAPFFGDQSVARYLRLSTFLADTSGCPRTRARAYGSVKNVSRMNLRGLKALVLIGSLRSGDYNGQVQTMDPSDLVPGEEAEIFLWLSCDWALRAAGANRVRSDNVLVVLADVAGHADEVAHPDGSSPFETPAPAKPTAPARTPTPQSPTGNAPLKPR